MDFHGSGMDFPWISLVLTGFHESEMNFLWISWISNGIPWIWDRSAVNFSMDFMDLVGISVDLGWICLL